MPPSWLSYVSVDDAAATAARAHELGGTVYGEAFDVLDAGRMAVLGDPTGAVLGVWQPREHIGAGRVNDPGCLTLNELHTRDPEAEITFYAGLFGWETEVIVENGEPVYGSINNAGSLNGGLMPMTEEHEDAPSYWLPYFTVTSIEGAVAKVRDLGGKLMAGPIDVPAGRIAVVSDPQGAAFALFEGETDD